MRVAHVLVTRDEVTVIEGTDVADALNKIGEATEAAKTKNWKLKQLFTELSSWDRVEGTDYYILDEIDLDNSEDYELLVWVQANIGVSPPNSK